MSGSQFLAIQAAISAGYAIAGQVLGPLTTILIIVVLFLLLGGGGSMDFVGAKGRRHAGTMQPQR